MRKHACILSPSIRFRLWSRKKYAAFASMHRCVTIGQVAKGIADSALGKDRNGAMLRGIRKVEVEHDRHEEGTAPDSGGGGRFAGLCPEQLAASCSGCVETAPGVRGFSSRLTGRDGKTCLQVSESGA